MKPDLLVLISGAPASGKTAIADALAARWRSEALGVSHISLGDALRGAASDGSLELVAGPDWATLATLLSEGRAIPHDVTERFLDRWLIRDDDRAIISGYPRFPQQLVHVRRLAEQSRLFVASLEVERSIAIDRFVSRKDPRDEEMSSFQRRYDEYTSHTWPLIEALTNERWCRTVKLSTDGTQVDDVAALLSDMIDDRDHVD